MKEESLLLLSDLQKLINQVVLIDYTIIILGGIDLAIKISNLDVKYKDIHAVKNVSFEVKDGEIFGMIGSNGAGKTTIIESIEGLRKKYDGSISVMGVDPKHERKKLYKTIGVQLQETSYQDKIRVKEIGKLFASFYTNPGDFDSLLRNFDLFEKRNSYVGKLSGGQRQKLSIILALMANPKILFLDEITTGLDPKSRRDIWDKIKQLNKDGMTVYMTTHFMEEAEYLCDRVAIVCKGKIVALDSLDKLVKSAGLSDTISFVCHEALDLDELSSWEGVKHCERNERYLMEGNADLVLEKLSRYMADRKISVSDIDVKRPNLEDVFFKYTGESLSETAEEK